VVPGGVLNFSATKFPLILVFALEKGLQGKKESPIVLKMDPSQTAMRDYVGKETIVNETGDMAEPPPGAPKEHSGWDVYNTESKRVDEELVKDWRESLDSLLIFVSISVKRPFKLLTGYRPPFLQPFLPLLSSRARRCSNPMQQA
jgi:hypothetical protein